MKPMTSKTATTSLTPYNRELIAALAIVTLQAVAAIFFLIDSIDEIILQISAGIDFAVIAEWPRCWTCALQNGNCPRENPMSRYLR